MNSIRRPTGLTDFQFLLAFGSHLFKTKPISYAHHNSKGLAIEFVRKSHESKQIVRFPIVPRTKALSNSWFSKANNETDGLIWIRFHWGWNRRAWVLAAGTILNLKRCWADCLKLKSFHTFWVFSRIKYPLPTISNNTKKKKRKYQQSGISSTITIQILERISFWHGNNWTLYKSTCCVNELFDENNFHFTCSRQIIYQFGCDVCISFYKIKIEFHKLASTKFKRSLCHLY